MYKMCFINHVVVDDRYILFTAGLNSDSGLTTLRGEIFVLEIGQNDDCTLTECDVNVPIDEHFQLFMTRNETKGDLLLCGWVKEYIGDSDLILNSDVIGMIHVFLCTGML